MSYLNKTQPNDQFKGNLISIAIPFTGFYGSNLEEGVESAVTSEIEYQNEDEPSVYLTSDDFDIDYPEIHDAIAKDYADFFASYVHCITDIPIACEFDALVSPRFYNFETDRIFCFVNRSDISKLLNWLSENAGKDYFKDYVRKAFSSYDGFIPYYDNDLSNWGHIDSWDSVQLSTVLGALVAFWDEGKDFYLTFEGAFYDSQSQDGFHVSEFMTRVMEA